jgi:hypothetical protein
MPETIWVVKDASFDAVNLTRSTHIGITTHVMNIKPKNGGSVMTAVPIDCNGFKQAYKKLC